MGQRHRDALEAIARLALEPADYDHDPRSEGVDIALSALEWEYWECSSRSRSIPLAGGRMTLPLSRAAAASGRSLSGASAGDEPLSAGEISALSSMAYYGRNWLILRTERNEDGMRHSAEKIEQARQDFRRAERKRRRDAKKATR